MPYYEQKNKQMGSISMNAEQVLKEMTLEEKAAFCSGRDFWHTKAIERLNVPSVMMCDGPHGLRKQEGEGDHLGINKSIETVCYPTAAALASSFDRDVMRRLGDMKHDASTGGGFLTIGQLMKHPKGAAFIRQMMGKSSGPSDSEQAEAMGEGSEKIMQQMMFDMPLGSLVSYGRMTSKQLKDLIASLNA